LKILGLDLGERWVGVAISSISGTLAFPVETVEVSDLVDFLPTFVKKNQIVKIVAGIPYRSDGSMGPQAVRLDEILEKTKEATKDLLPTNFEWIKWDECLTSAGALEVLHENNKSIRKNKKQEHAIAAALILESFLAAQPF
jgi:putative Holliday junction resolvase